MDYVARASRNDRVVISEFCPERPYLEIQLPDNVTHIEKLLINITSHDQGFCSDEGLKGAGGYTWFEANVVTPSGRNNIPRQLLARNQAGEPSWQVHQASFEIPGPNTSSTRPLVPGLNAQYRNHSTLSQIGFLDEIRAGDTIQIIPKARWQAWMNFVRAADMEIHCKTVPPLETMNLASEKPSYDQLDQAQRSIRLLSVHPGSGTDMLSCELLPEHLLGPNQKEFEALSYCWGNSSIKKTIQLHQPNEITKSMQVTSSLYGALLHLRKPDTARILWVDAICINQGDLKECGDQVGMMGEIYSRAKDVIVWLSEGNDETKAAANSLWNIFAYFQVPTEEELAQGLSRGSFPPLTGIAFDGTRIQETFNADHIAPFLQQMSRFFSIPWFWRVWVVQEAWLSKKAIFCCGDDIIEWDAIWRANVWMNIHGFNMPDIEQKALPLIWTSLKRLQEQSEHREAPLREGLLNLVLQGLDLKATDPRDKLFGLLGLAEETHSGQVSPSDPLLYPSYTKSTSAVFADFTKWWIQKHKSLKILSAIHATDGRTWQSLDCTSGLNTITHVHPPPEHPSWALWHSGHSKWANELLGFSPSYTASGKSEVNLDLVSTNNNSSELRLSGIRLGIIVSIAPFRWYNNDEDLCAVFNRLFDASGARRIWNNPVSSGLQLNEDGWDDVGGHLYSHYGDYEGEEESEEEGEEDEEKEDKEDKEGDGEESEKEAEVKKEDGEDKGEEDNEREEDNEGEEDSEGSGKDLEEDGDERDAETNQSDTSDSNPVPEFSCLDDCLFKTAEGLVGLCPAGTKIGDVIVVLFGGSVPYVVREKSDGDTIKYQFVGECYVQEKMDGSALESSAGVKPSGEDFTLI